MVAGDVLNGLHGWVLILVVHPVVVHSVVHVACIAVALADSLARCGQLFLDVEVAIVLVFGRRGVQAYYS